MKDEIIKIIKEELAKLLFEKKEKKEKKHAMYNPKTGKKVMADGEKHKELAKKGYVHFNPKDAKSAIDKEGGAAGVKAIAKHTGADKSELEKYLDKIKGIVKHSKGDYITTSVGRTVAEEMIREELEAVLTEKRKKRKRKKKKKKKSSGKKDACYHKVRSRYAVWPSAYASGALVKCRKVGAKNWGNKSKKKKK